jgi:hypothetical protein
MGINYFIEAVDYNRDPFLLAGYSEVAGFFYDGKNDMRAVQRDIAADLTHQYIAPEEKDKRFIVALNKIQGCAAFSLKTIFLRPSETILGGVIKQGYIFALPVAHIMDAVVNSTQVIVHTALVIDAVAVGCLRPVAKWFLPKSLTQDSQEKNFDFSHTRFIDKMGNLMSSFWYGILEIPLLPLYYVGIMNPLMPSKFSYWVYDSNSKKFHLVLDQEKVKWLQEKYGYPKHVKVLKKILIPSNPIYQSERINFPSGLRFSYDAASFKTPEDIKVTATWIFWEHTHSVGNVHYYKKNRKAGTHF